MTTRTATRQRGPRRVDPRWAELADRALVIAREIQIRPYADERVRHLSASEGMVMRYLQGNDGATPTRIAAAVGLQRTNLSAVLRGLEQKDLIERRTSTDDRRVVTVHLSERGRDHYQLARKEWAAAVAAAAGNDTRHLNEAIELLARLSDGMIEDRAGDSPSPVTEVDGR
jgi:DNA-binding MarR family transcriptional regulator